MKILKSIIKSLVAERWKVGFIQGDMSSVMNDAKELCIHIVQSPSDRWYADPFILDVTEDEILLLVEDVSPTTQKGVISLLHIERKTFIILSCKKILELPTHLSFPAILR